jgi:hypothetical protein
MLSSPTAPTTHIKPANTNKTSTKTQTDITLTKKCLNQPSTKSISKQTLWKVFYFHKHKTMKEENGGKK